MCAGAHVHMCMEVRGQPLLTHPCVGHFVPSLDVCKQCLTYLKLTKGVWQVCEPQGSACLGSPGLGLQWCHHTASAHLGSPALGLQQCATTLLTFYSGSGEQSQFPTIAVCSGCVFHLPGFIA